MGSSRSHRDANSCGTFGSTPRFRRPFRIFPSEKKETLGRGTWRQQLKRRCPPRVSKRDYAQSASRHSLPRRLAAPGPATVWVSAGPREVSARTAAAKCAGPLNGAPPPDLATARPRVVTRRPLRRPRRAARSRRCALRSPRTSSKSAHDPPRAGSRGSRGVYCLSWSRTR